MVAPHYELTLKLNMDSRRVKAQRGSRPPASCCLQTGSVAG